MKHLIIEYPNDEKVNNIEDCYMLGDILVAPILEEGRMARNVYLPEGNWIGLWPMEAELLDYNEDSNTPLDEMLIENREDETLKLKGGYSYRVKSGQDRIPVFIREGGCMVLNLDDTLKIGSKLGNKTSGYKNLCFYITGSEGEYHFKDDEKNELLIKWSDDSYEVNHISGNLDIKVIYI